MGHEACVAVKAGISGGHFPHNIEELVAHVEPAVKKAKAKNLDEQGTLIEAIQENVGLQIEHAHHDSEVLHELAEKKGLKIVGAVYSLQTGKVKFLSDNIGMFERARIP